MQHARKLSHLNTPAVPQPGGGPLIRPQPGTKLKKVKFLLILLTCFILSIAVVAQYSSMVVMNYRFGSARAELAEVREAVKVLELESAQLGSIGRIEQIARSELGMVEPEVSQLRVITANRDIVSRQGE